MTTVMTVVREANGPAEAMLVLTNTADREMVTFDAYAGPRTEVRARPQSGFRPS